ncbi:MAG: BtpA/SgcQ family protein, partial [bacterium]
RHGADAVIVTGSWTGKPPSVEEVRMLRDRLGDQPLLIGSGVDRENVAELLSAANGAVVSTSLKEGESVGGEINVKPYSRRISEDRVRELMAALK